MLTTLKYALAFGAALTLMAPDTSMAGTPDDQHRYGKRHGGKHGGYGKRHNNRKAYNRGYRAGRSSSYYGGYYSYPGWGFGYRTNNFGAALGATIGSAIIYSTVRDAMRHDHHDERPIIIQQTPPASTQEQANTGIPIDSVGYDRSQCQQEREYTTKIMVGGKEQEAYGQACLMPDGSWKLGTPTPVPNFDQ